MSTITFSGPGPIDLVPQRPATAVADGDSVVMTLPSERARFLGKRCEFSCPVDAWTSSICRARADGGGDLGSPISVLIKRRHRSTKIRALPHVGPRDATVHQCARFFAPGARSPILA